MPVLLSESRRLVRADREGEVSLIPEQRDRTVAVSLSGLSRYKTEELMGSDKVISL